MIITIEKKHSDGSIYVARYNSWSDIPADMLDKSTVSVTETVNLSLEAARSMLKLYNVVQEADTRSQADGSFGT